MAVKQDGATLELAMFRAMKRDSDGYPLVGRSSRTLGVRVEGPFPDIPVAEDGSVAPETGGMSVALAHATNLPKHRLPRLLGGEGRDPVFRMSAELLAETLRVRSDHYPHALVGPHRRISLPEFEVALGATRSYWSVAHD